MLVLKTPMKNGPMLQNQDIDDFSVQLHWHSTSYLSERPEPEWFTYPADGSVLAIDEFDNEHTAGRFRVFYVDAERALNSRMNIYDVLDASATTAEYFDALFDIDTLDFNTAVRDITGPGLINDNLLIVDRVELLPEYRGKHLGLHIVKHLIERFGAGTEVVALKPYPLQFEFEDAANSSGEWRPRLALDRFPQDSDTAFSALKGHYEKLGFVQVSDTPFYIISTDWRLPELGT